MAKTYHTISKPTPVCVEGFTKHSDYHYSRQLNGHQLDYWPTKRKFMYKNEVMVGNVHNFIKDVEDECN